MDCCKPYRAAGVWAYESKTEVNVCDCINATLGVIDVPLPAC